jgi:hypothetical protein
VGVGEINGWMYPRLGNAMSDKWMHCIGKSHESRATEEPWLTFRYKKVMLSLTLSGEKNEE